jgi:hypothetical protein
MFILLYANTDIIFYTFFLLIFVVVVGVVVRRVQGYQPGLSVRVACYGLRGGAPGQFVHATQEGFGLRGGFADEFFDCAEPASEAAS